MPQIEISRVNRTDLIEKIELHEDAILVILKEEGEFWLPLECKDQIAEGERVLLFIVQQFEVESIESLRPGHLAGKIKPCEEKCIYRIIVRGSVLDVLVKKCPHYTLFEKEIRRYLL